MVCIWRTGGTGNRWVCRAVVSPVRSCTGRLEEWAIGLTHKTHNGQSGHKWTDRDKHRRTSAEVLKREVIWWGENMFGYGYY